jgi:Na+/phosphate symporter
VSFTPDELRLLAISDQVEESTEGMTPEERNRHHSLMSRLRRLEREGDAYRQLHARQVREWQQRNRRASA